MLLRVSATLYHLPLARRWQGDAATHRPPRATISHLPCLVVGSSLLPPQIVRPTAFDSFRNFVKWRDTVTSVVWLVLSQVCGRVVLPCWHVPLLMCGLVCHVSWRDTATSVVWLVLSQVHALHDQMLSRLELAVNVQNAHAPTFWVDVFMLPPSGVDVSRRCICPLRHAPRSAGGARDVAPISGWHSSRGACCRRVSSHAAGQVG